MAVHIKQVKGADDLVARDNFVKDNLQGKISFQDNKLVLSVPLAVGKTSSGDSYDFSQLTEDDIVTKKYVDETVENLKGEVSEGYDTLREIEIAVKSISSVTGAEPITAQSDSQTGTKVGSISIGDNVVNFYIDLSSYVQKSGNGAAFEVAPTAPSISSAFDDNHLVTASFVHEVEKKLIGLAEETMTTLSEISGAVNHDPNYHTAVDSALSNKLGKDDITITPVKVETNGTLIGTIILNEETYELKVDLSLLAPLNSPNFTGSPTVPDVAKNDASSLVANTRFVSMAISDAVTSIKGSPPDDLNTLEKISNAIGNDTALADNINSSISAIDSMISALNVSISSTTGSSSSTDNDKQPLSEALTSISSLPTAADMMIYTTAKDKYAVTTLTNSARDLISKTDEEGMREYLSVPKTDGTGASGNWSITADKAVNDKDGNSIDTTYLKVDDAVNVSVNNLITGTDVTRLGTITIGDKQHDINVNLSSYAPLSSPSLVGSPTAPTPDLTDSSTKIANTGFVQSVVSGAISDLVGEGTPEALNTLKEISDIIGDNSDFTGAIITELGNKVTKVTGKELSSNDFTNTLKDKLDNIADNANNYSLPDATTSTKGGVIIGDGLTVSNGKVSVAAATTGKIGGIKLGNGVTVTAGGVVSIQSATANQNGLMTSEQASKLVSIVSGSEANAINIIKVNGVSLTPDSTKAVNIEIPDIPDIDGKVDKETDKGLSSNDYTTEEKNKLESIASGATKNDVSLIAGTANATTNTSASDPYINLTDNNVKKGFVQIKGGDNVTISSDASGVITIQSSDTTYDVVSKSSNGLVPSLPSDKTQFLRSDGSWATLAGSDTTYEAGKGISLDSNSNAFSVKVPANSGLSITDNGISLTAAQTNVIGGVKVAAVTTSNISLASDGGIGVPLATTSQAGAVKIGTNLTVNNGTVSLSSTNVTDALGFTPADSASIPAAASVMTGASASNAGKAGLVPAPAKGDQDKFLKGNGTWTTVSAGSVSNVGLVAAATANGTLNATSAADNTYINLTDNNEVKGTIKIIGDGNITVKSDNAGIIKISGTSAGTNTGTGTTYTAGNGLTLSGGAFSVKTPSNSGLSVTSNGVSLTAATGSAIGGVKIGTGISTGAGGVISIPSATTAVNGLMTTAQVNSLAAVVDATKNSVSLTAGASKGTVNAAVTANPYINITDNGSNKGSIQLKGDGAVTISSNAAGIISITSANDKVAQSVSAENKTYPVLLSSKVNATDNVAASNVIFGSGIKINPKYSAITVGDSITINGSEGTIQLGSRVLLDSNTANVFTGTCSLESLRNDSLQPYYTGQVYVTVSNPKFAIQKGSTIAFKMPSLNTNILANSQLDTKLHFYFGTESNSSIKTGTVAYNAASMQNNDTYTLRLQDIPKDGYYVSVTNNESGYLFSTNTFVQPIRLGGTGATTVAEAKTKLGIKQKTAARFIITYNAASETPNIFTLTSNDLTVESGTIICVRFNGFNDITNHNNIILNINGSGNSYIAYNYTTYLTVAQVQNGKYYYLYRSGDTWLVDDGANNMLNGWHIGRLYFPNTGKKGLDGIKMLDQLSTVAGGNFLVSAGQKLFLSAGEMFNDIYNNSSVSSSIDGGASGESVWLVSDDEVKIWTGVTENNRNEFTMTKQGVFTAPKITTDLLSGPAVHSTTVKGDLGWANKATDGLQVITKNSLAYWDGRYNSVSSNLAYCSLGAFGTAATTAASIYPSLAGNNTFSGTNTFTGRTYVKERLIMSTGLAMSSVSTNKWNTAVDNYGQSYTPAGGVAWYHAENSATGVFGITNGSIGSSASNLLLTSGGSLILSAGEAPALNLLRAYGTPNSMYQSINGNGQMHLMSQYDIEFVTNAGNSLDPSNIKRFVFYRNGNATIPGALTLGAPLSIANGGTGATTPAEALNNLGVSTVAADVALQAMGLGNGTGCYTCNISLSGATLVNNSASPMTGFTLKDGVNVYFYVSSTSTVTTAAALSFNGTTSRSAFLVSGATATKASVKSFAAGYYRAVYHTSAIGSGTANTWLVFKET